MKKILLCDEDVNFGTLQKEMLQFRGFQVDFVTNGLTAWNRLQQGDYSLLITEMNVPERSATDIIHDLRLMELPLPVIIYSSDNDEKDQEAAYMAGCDEYIQKPCPITLLELKINAILRRYQPEVLPTVFQWGEAHFDSERQQLTITDTTTKLSSHENELLLYLAQHINTILDRSDILKRVWRNDDYFSSRSMNVYINKLKKILAPAPQLQIVSIRGRGYKLMYNSDMI